MLEIIVWVILFSIFAGIVLVLNYWANLFRSQEQYTRDELLDFVRIIMDQIQRLTTQHGNPALNFGSLACGIGAAWLLTLFGGLVSPAAPPHPDHASAQIPNYFFQSALFLMILHVVWPSLKDMAVGRGGPDSLLFRIVDTEVPFFFGLSVGLASINIAVWGVFHEMNFLFSLVNALVCLGYAFFRLTGLSEERP
ncbi:MAG: hypothetical protein HY042_06970 [Spirochaetia bacterium]|nr:hypothetical protein [Spirochaetia bacterium]